MEMRIIGSGVELAEFLKVLGTSTIQIPPVAITPTIEEAVDPKDEEYIPLKEAVKSLNLSRQTLINYSNYGMPHERRNKCYFFCLNDVKPWIQDYQSKHKSSIRGMHIRRNKTISVSNFSQWKSELIKACREADKDEGKMLSLTYKYMTKNYGIVWDQTKKDFYKSEGYMPRSTCKMAYWLECTKPVYKGITISCLSTILKENE